MLTAKHKVLLFLLALIQFTHVMDFMIIMPLGNQLMGLFEINPRQFGFIVSAYTVMAGIVGFAGAFFIDHFDRKRILIVCYIGFLIGTFACGLAPTYEFMLAARILTGAFGGILSTLILSIVGDAIPIQSRATAMGFVTAGFSLASIFGVPFGNALATRFNWHAPFFFIAGIGVLIAIAAALLVPSMRAHINSKSTRPGPLLVLQNLKNNLNQRKALLLMFLLMMGQFTVIPFIAAYMEKNVGFSQNDVTKIYFFGGLCTVFSAPLAGRIADRIGKQKVFAFFALLSIAPILLITHMGHWPMWLVLVITSLFFIVITGRMVPAMAVITGTTLPQTRGSFMSFNSSVQQLSAGIAAFISGSLIVENSQKELMNYNYIGYIASVAALLSIWAVYRIVPAEEFHENNLKQVNKAQTENISA